MDLGEVVKTNLSLVTTSGRSWKGVVSLPVPPARQIVLAGSGGESHVRKVLYQNFHCRKPFFEDFPGFFSTLAKKFTV
jgi:hypothetical protein